jgi:peptidyl-prolyl cis-trans isomerase A (cyclophilin A)/peptidyl-prolyl cis-trans isomerase B (cyclophilin B)
MRARHRTLTLRLALALVAACACLVLVHPTARADDVTASDPEVRVTTSMGSFVVELYPDRAPLTVANFLRYVREGFYTNTLFHRVVANFVIQGGGHDANPPYDLKPTYPPVDNESGNGLQNKRGAVGLARATGPHTGNAQFYVNLVDNPELDPLPTRWGYTVFGQVVEGMDVVDRIGVVPTGAFGPFKADSPVKPLIIQSVTLITPPGLTTPPASTPPAASPAGASPTGTPPSGPTPSPTPSGTKPATPPPATPPGTQPKSKSGEADQPDGG